MIRRYVRRTTFVPSKFLSRILRGRGGLLSFGVNLRVQGLLSVYAFVSFRAKCTLITSLSEIISVFKQPTSSVVFVPPSTPVHTVSALGLRYCDTYQLRLCVRSVVAITLSCNCRTESHDSMDVGSLTLQTFP